MIISKYFVYFIFYSFLGWIYETIFCTIKGGKWENRGFLFGPICPIYGVGADTMMIILDVVHHYTGGGFEFTWWQIFIIAFFGSIVLEYVTSYVLERKFHAVWWDYSNIPLNIHGRICLPASLGFGFGGLLVVYFIIPRSVGLGSNIPPLAMEIMSLVFMALLAADLTLTVSALTDFEKYVAGFEDNVNKKMDAFVDGIAEKVENAGSFVTEKAESATAYVTEKKENATAYVNEKKESATAYVNEKKENATAYMAEKKDTWIENAASMKASKSKMYQSAVKRVHHFKYKKVEPKKLEDFIRELKSKKKH
ncbi:MAG: metal-dependent phosphohydrolase [Lachnospiraceae bacterium]|nr:metal-dependent phosphohydrolase [Lachnospiraceae bacterium]